MVRDYPWIDALNLKRLPPDEVRALIAACVAALHAAGEGADGAPCSWCGRYPLRWPTKLTHRAR